MDLGDCKVFVGGLPPQTTQESLVSYLSQYGQITECKVVMDMTTGRSKGYGFVVYSTPQEAQAAVAKGFLTVDGKKCNCNLASLGAKKLDTTTAKKRSFSEDYLEGTGAEGFSTNYDAVYGDSYSAYAAGYTMPVAAASPGVDMQNYQMQMNMNSSLTMMYNDIQAIKYEITMLSQSITSLKSTIVAMKTGVDALCARQGIVVPNSVPFQ
jgi:RNA recognition motif-containing protein